jgi:hypothetical protein
LVRNYARSVRAKAPLAPERLKGLVNRRALSEGVID